MGSVYDWSLIAADNANADDSINWAEGQPPSSVNNSARAMMQHLREFIADLSGCVVAGGLSNALVLKSHASIKTYEDGLRIRFRASGRNGAQTTLNLNNLGAKPIMKAGLQRPQFLEGGELQAGSIYECIYNAGLNTSGAWFLISPAFIATKDMVLPAGFIAAFGNYSAPPGWLKCNGSWIGRIDYNDLYKAIGSRFGYDSEGVSFRLPDLRGEFIRGWIDERTDIATQKEREFGAWENDKIKYHRHKGTTEFAGLHRHELDIKRGSADGGDYGRGLGSTTAISTHDAGNHSHNFTTDLGVNENDRFSDETRPRNIALLYCIKY